MASHTQLSMPKNLAGIRALSDEDKAIFSVLAASGRNQGAYYTRQGDKYVLHKSASLDKETPPEFEQSFSEIPENSVTVNDVAGTTKGFFVFKQTYPKEFSNDFIEKYIKEPEATEKAKRDIAQYIADANRPFLWREASLAIQSITKELLRRPEDKMRHLRDIGQLTLKAYDAGMPQASDEKSHVEGFNQFMRLALQKLNLRTGGNVANSEAFRLVETLGAVHNAGKLQLSAQYLRPWRDKLTEADQAKSPQEQEAIKARKKAYFDQVNHNHPLLTYLLLSNMPEEASAAALHHLSLFRDQDSEETRIAAKKWNMIDEDVKAHDITPLSKLMFVAEVADAMLNNERTNPVKMLESLYAKTNITNHLGMPMIMPMIDPAMLEFLLRENVIDEFVKSKSVDGRPSNMDEAYTQKKAEILEALAPFRDEDRIKGELLKDPLLQASKAKRRT